MLGKNQPASYWLSIDILPVVHDRVIAAIQASEKAMQFLQGTLENSAPYDLWSDEECLHDHEGQIEQLILLKQQCGHFKKNRYLSLVQKGELLHLEVRITECEKLSQKVIAILQDRLR